ncbi:MAG: hypothetical protein AB7P04_16065, partial [Bacteriovoracia bacterium]
ATLENEAGNQLCADKEMNRKMKTLLTEVRPENFYFGIKNGQRAFFCVVNVEGSHELPRITEPFWLGFRANVECTAIMTQEDFRKSVNHIESSVRKFNWTSK